MRTGKRIRPVLEWVEDKLHVPVFPRDRILSAVSADGCHWERVAGVAVDVKGSHGSEMVYWPHLVTIGGTRRLFFVGSQRINGHWRERILSAVCREEGRWWVEPDERISPGGESDGQFAFSPWIVEISGGYRMYYGGKSSDKMPCILSAVSKDGYSWNKEPGLRLAPMDFCPDGAYAPSVIRNGNEWQMYYSSRSGYSVKIAAASSVDGLIWSRIEQSRDALLNPGPRLCAANPSVVMYSGKRRIYYSGHDGNVYGARIYFSELQDGANWSAGKECLDYSGVYEGAEVEYCHVVMEKQGGWTMFYTGFWGKHLLYPLTKYSYSNKARVARKWLEQ